MIRKILTISVLSAALAVPALANKSMHSDSQQQQSGGMMQSQSSDLISVQEKLNERGYDVGSVDGKMGKKTKQAIRKFQQDQGLKVTGRLDQNTHAALMAESDEATGGQQAPSTGAQPSDQIPQDQQPSGVERSPGTTDDTGTMSPDTSGSTTTPDTTGSETKQGESNY